MKNNAIVDPSMANAVKSYLDDSAKKDPALAAVYDQNKIGECCEFIVDKVRDAYIKANGRRDGGCFESHQSVYKMARDFFIEGHNIAEESPSEEEYEGEEASVAPEKEKPAQPAKPAKKRLGELEQLDLFGGIV